MTQLLTIEQNILACEKDFVSIAQNHSAVVWREECEFAKQAFQKNSYLAECNPATVQGAVKNVATVGLTLNPAHGLAYLVPEFNKSTRTKDCQLRISFQGLVKLATNSGAIKLVKAEIVREKDIFEYNGSLSMPKHTITNPFNEQERGQPIGVYCIAITHEDRTICDLMSWQEVLKIKAAAKTQAVWDKWTEEMAKKALIKRAYKQWPKTDKNQFLANAVGILNEQEGNKNDDELKEEMQLYLNERTPLEFFLFIKGLDENDYNALYNSGEKGEKVKLKKQFEQAEKDGSADVRELIFNVRSDDDETKEEALEAINKLEEKLRDTLRGLMKK
jgi:recombination protein RecT